MNLGIEANSSRTVFFDDAGITLISTTGPIFARYAPTKTKTKVSQGQMLGREDGQPLGNVTFINDNSIDVELIVGPWGVTVNSVAPDQTGVTANITNAQNPIQMAWWDHPTASNRGGVTQPDGDMVVIPSNKPFRRVWAYFDASVFAAGQSAFIIFYLNGSSVMILDAHVKANAGANPIWGMAMTPSFDNGNRAMYPGSYAWQITGTGGMIYTHPHDVYIIADAVAFSLSATLRTAPVIRAMLRCQSFDVKP